MSRYEHVIEVLTAQALAQQDEINQLRAILTGSVGLPAADVAGEGRGEQLSSEGHALRRHECAKAVVESNSPNTLRKCNNRHSLPKGWRRRVEDYTVQLLEAYMRYMDECLAQGLVERLRRVTRKHVIRSLDKEISRVMQERQRLLQDRRILLRQALDADNHQHHRMCSSSVRLKEKESRVSVDHIIPASRAWPKERDASHVISVMAKEDARRCGSFRNSPLRQREVDLGRTTEMRPCISSLATDSSVSGSGASYLRQLDHTLLEQLRRKVLVLEKRLAAASSSDFCGNEPSSSPPPPVETTHDCMGNSGEGFSSCPPTNSSSVINASDDIELLLNVFEGLQPANAVQKLVL
ncbi:hypothetical protein TraAM80_01444 [Trypanosoma rangeli]|uniref:Uncharacterized protein n=1 Tax=Trypanosoma rangeli TaxID=5698 RepID=A0A3S5ISC6_TRYRA|nr:uncharacterized protein TraAM80_01444 [Trypanosoma rangeli]RNF10628.1 hypothetical protein TraAM80_01444 [Trypanosoma rangeli]|eukprot:RNF10628.1 hypothetical protein TraAM80_01444 [Trypanosoma rangeli]